MDNDINNSPDACGYSSNDADIHHQVLEVLHSDDNDIDNLYISNGLHHK